MFANEGQRREDHKKYLGGGGMVKNRYDHIFSINHEKLMKNEKFEYYFFILYE